ncbi:MAG: sirohydrochlorin cobaltochelatase, partial [Lachnospiraceae bacterium]|nr:sirohydrochlorin cobaltochelatase [Lachnospiraceae bacterium]
EVEEDTGDASLDDPGNEDGIKEKEMLVVSFGTSYNDARRLNIGAIEDALEKEFKDYSVRRAFTSQIIIDHIKDRDKVTIDNVDEALKRASDNGVKELVVVATHLMNGFEYNELVENIAEYSDAFEKVAISEPLLTSDEDFERVIEAVKKATEKYDDGSKAIVFMGHGTEAASNEVYGRIQKAFDEAKMENYYIGTVEASPSLDDVIALLKDKEYKEIVLRPLMVVAGDHANNDMASDEEDSWKSILTKEGYEVEAVLEGLGQLEDIRNIYIDHAKEAVRSIEE